MKKIDFDQLTAYLGGQRVDRPNKAAAGTLSGHAAGEPFEKAVYRHLKTMYPENVFKQHEFLNDIYLKHPQHISARERFDLFDSPTVLFLLSRGEKATREWSAEHLFEEKQNDTADMLCHCDGHYELIDVKTRNVAKQAQAPNIISAYKLAKMCTYMIDNEEFDKADLHYVEVAWHEEEDSLVCTEACHAALFNAPPDTLYINWAAGMQIQFHVFEVDQTWKGTRREWTRAYLAAFVASAEHRCSRMRQSYIDPFLPYL